ncbi:S-layer homology domain-containing protein [Paenibacillus sp. UNCCL117]|uniref:S-layer homology domain-containing protein n=1 Tax=unclassified Paenibacillus TaxID=185978 RepID=UPI000889057A|nr:MULTISPECIES: S-layer homology domain-containing protein [unclassified Paenibacillus]SDE60627.1 S-layer homology domain-containing protein [Paenibacillus sp. cl123]SFW69587.1 S-layer homology domain-containing protein [Paenibacillus sp. UNCCL117]
MTHRMFKHAALSVLALALLAAAPGTGAYALEPAGGHAAVRTADAASSNPHGIADGVYSMAYTFKKFNTDQASVMQEYVVNPGRLTVKDGKMLVQITLKQGKEITGFKLERGGSLVEPQVVASDEQSNTRTVEFAVQDLTATIKGWVKIYWQVTPTFLYDHEYDIHLTFDPSSLKELAVPASPSPGKETQPESGQTKSSSEVSFKDLGGHWAKEAVERAVSLGIAGGYEDGTFRPDGEINRAEFAALLSRALGLEAGSQQLSFTDLADIPDWVKPHLAPIAESGLIGGYEDGSFRPARKISRAELAVIGVRASKLTVEPGKKPAFADAAAIPLWAQAEAAAAHEAGLIGARDNNRFDPEASATRAEAVSLVMALHQLSGK